MWNVILAYVLIKIQLTSLLMTLFNFKLRCELIIILILSQMPRSVKKRSLQHSESQHPSIVPSMIQLPPVSMANAPPIHKNSN